MRSIANNKQVLSSFDYDIIDYKNRNLVRQRTEEIRVQLRRAARDIWEIGQKLVEVRSQLKHGQFEAWLKAEFGWSHRTAYNFINVYEAFGKPANFAEIEIAASALYLLAAPSTPKQVREHFVQQASLGEKITYKDVQKTLKGSPEAAPARRIEGAVAPTPTASTSLGDLKEQDSQLSPAASVVHPSENSMPELSDPKFTSQTSATGTSQIVKVQAERKLNYHAPTSFDSIQPGWYLLEGRHLLFCGDTAKTQFAERMPQAAFAMITLSGEWHHDWLIHKARAVSILQASDLTEKLIEQLLLLHSVRGEAVIFPSLPSALPIAVAHKLGRQIYAGDPEPERCHMVIESLGIRAERVSWVKT